MSIEPFDFLDSARQLATGSGEVATRNVISRAYYAAYHQARGAYPPDQDFAKKSASGMHAAYIDQLMQAEPRSIQRTVAVKLQSLRGKRTKADYRLFDAIQPYEGGMQIHAAQEVFDLLSTENMPPGPELGTEKLTPEPASHPPSRPKLQRII